MQCINCNYLHKYRHREGTIKKVGIFPLGRKPSKKSLKFVKADIILDLELNITETSGVAIGLQDTSGQLLTIFTAVMSHKVIIIIIIIIIIVIIFVTRR